MPETSAPLLCSPSLLPARRHRPGMLPAERQLAAVSGAGIVVVGPPEPEAACAERGRRCTSAAA